MSTEDRRPRAATSLRISPTAITVDGEPFPWEVAEEGIVVEPVAGVGNPPLTFVTLRLAVMGPVTFDDDPKIRELVTVEPRVYREGDECPPVGTRVRDNCGDVWTVRPGGLVELTEATAVALPWPTCTWQYVIVKYGPTLTAVV